MTGSRATRLSLPFLLAAALLLAVPSGAFATRTLGLSSGSFKFDVSAGKTVGGVVYVTNDGTEPIKVLVYSSDQKVDPKGNITYSVPSRGDLSGMDQPSTWTQVKMPEDSQALGNIPYIELAPKQRVPVKFSFTIPPNVPPGDHNVMIFFEMFELPKAGQGAVSAVSGRLGSRITLRVAGDFVERLEVRPFVVPSFVIGSEVPYRFTVSNLGNIDQRVGARMLLLDRNDDTVVEQTPIDGRIVFAGNSLEASGTAIVQKGGIGKYTLRVDVSPVDDAGKALKGGKDTITKSRTVWLLPLWLVIAVGTLLVLIIARLVWALARRSARRSLGDGGDTPGPEKAPRSKHSRSRDPETQARREARERRRAGEATASVADDVTAPLTEAPTSPVAEEPTTPLAEDAPDDSEL